MKVGDIVKVRAGHWNMLNMSLSKGVLEEAYRATTQKRSFRVCGLNGIYPTCHRTSLSPTHDGFYDKLGSEVVATKNDTMLIDERDFNFVLFTRERFCDVIKSSSSQPTEVEITVPRGTNAVRLILQ